MGVFVDTPPNPYASLLERSSFRPATWPVAGILCFSLWLLLAGGVWFGRTQMLPVFQDFDVKLRAVTRLVLSALYPLAIVLVGLAFAAVICAAHNSTYYRWLWSISLVTTTALGLLSVYGFFRPLVTLITPLTPPT